MTRSINLSYFVLVILAIAFSGCAHKVSPTGGEKDLVSPTPSRMTPENFSTNLDKKKIFIDFDEFIADDEVTLMISGLTETSQADADALVAAAGLETFTNSPTPSPVSQPTGSSGNATGSWVSLFYSGALLVIAASYL